MKKRKYRTDGVADAPAENHFLGEETSAAAPAAGGDESGLSEPLPTAPENETIRTEQVADGPRDESGLTEQPANPHVESPNGSQTAPVEAMNWVEEPQPPLPPPPLLADEARAHLEDRLRRLEDSLALLNELKQQQAREQAAKPATLAPPVPTALVAPLAQIVPTPTPAAPITTTPSEAATAFLFNVGKHFLAPPVAAVAQPQSPPPSESVFTISMRWGAFLFEVYAEVRTIVRMSVDPRYRMPLSSRFIPWILLALIFSSFLWVPGSSLPYIGPLFDKLVDVPLAFLLFKVLSHEARRYRQTSPDLPPSLRLPDH